MLLEVIICISKNFDQTYTLSIKLGLP